jgi:hypothetical protein
VIRCLEIESFYCVGIEVEAILGGKYLAQWEIINYSFCFCGDFVNVLFYYFSDPLIE